LFLAYTLALYFFRPQVHRSQSHWQENVITAQRYIYSSSPQPVVIVGSSLSTRLLKLPPDYWNLSFGSGSGLTGLTIVAREAHCPELVLIETNVLMEVDQAFLAKLYNPFLYHLKRYALSLREEYHPLNVLMTMWFGQPSEVPASDGPKRQPRVPREVLQIVINKAKAPIDDHFRSEMGRQLNALVKLVDALEAKQSVPVFYWMPTHPEVSMAPVNEYQRRAFLDKFPESRYRWIPDPPSDRYQTADGVHLGQSEALDYCRHFVDAVELIRKEVSNGLAKPRPPLSLR
jgi:hypothetical protein